MLLDWGYMDQHMDKQNSLTCITLLCVCLLQGELIYVNYGRIEDFKWLSQTKNINFTDRICIARYGRIMRGDKVTPGRETHTHHTCTT